MFDIHSHILPGIDDGAKSLADSVELCRVAASEGVRKIVATPHIRESRWANTRGGIATLVEELRAELTRQQVSIEVVLGAEIYYVTGILDAIREGMFPTYGDWRQHLLLELPSFFVPRQVQNLVFELRTAGLTPVIAHPERNTQLMSNLEALEGLVRMGALLQVTGMSITGRFGREARKASKFLLDRDWVHVVASDAHHCDFRPPRLVEAHTQIAKSYGTQRAERLFVTNPGHIVAGRDVPAGLPTTYDPAPRGLRALLERLVG